MDARQWHREIAARPDDDTVRLAYADWLDERDQGDDAAWAAFVRKQIAEATRPPVLVPHLFTTQDDWFSAFGYRLPFPAGHLWRHPHVTVAHGRKAFDCRLQASETDATANPWTIRGRVVRAYEGVPPTESSAPPSPRYHDGPGWSFRHSLVRYWRGFPWELVIGYKDWVAGCEAFLGHVPLVRLKLWDTPDHVSHGACREAWPGIKEFYLRRPTTHGVSG